MSFFDDIDARFLASMPYGWLHKYLVHNIDVLCSYEFGGIRAQPPGFSEVLVFEELLHRRHTLQRFEVGAKHIHYVMNEFRSRSNGMNNEVVLGIYDDDDEVYEEYEDDDDFVDAADGTATGEPVLDDVRLAAAAGGDINVMEVESNHIGDAVSGDEEDEISDDDLQNMQIEGTPERMLEQIVMELFIQCRKHCQLSMPTVHEFSCLGMNSVQRMELEEKVQFTIERLETLTHYIRIIVGEMLKRCQKRFEDWRVNYADV